MSSFNLNDYVDLEDKEDGGITPPTTDPVPSSSHPNTNKVDETLSLWDMYPQLDSHPLNDAKPYADPFENLHLNTKQALPFRTLMLEHKYNLDSLFKSLNRPACRAQPLTVYSLQISLSLAEIKAALDLGFGIF
jgi:hypothetical protein